MLKRITNSHLAKKTTGTFGLKILLVGLSFITSIVLARLLSVDGYGIYAYVLAWVSVLQIPSSLGLQSILVRDVMAYQSNSEPALVRGLLRWSNRLALWVSIAIALASAAVAWLVVDDHSSMEMWAFIVALTSLPLLSLTALRQGAMRGFNYVVLGQLPENLIQPAILLLLLLCSYFAFDGDVSPLFAIGLRVFAIGVSFVVGAVLLGRVLPASTKIVDPKYDARQWTKSVFPFLLISCTHVINNRTDSLMLGSIEGAASVGIYLVASKGAELTSFILVAINRSIGPAIAKLHATDNLDQLQALVTKSTRTSFAVSLPVSLGLILFGRWFLWLFGTDFLAGYSALVILTVGQLINTASGSVGLMLDMTGHEKISATGIGISALLNIALNFVLIPRYGIEGAAIATASSYIFWNVFLVIQARRIVGIRSTIFG